MKKTLIATLTLLSLQTAHAGGLYLGCAYDFIPGYAEAAFGYRARDVAFETAVLKNGKEEPATKPGPQYSFNLLAFPPVLLPQYPPLHPFFKGGLVAGSGKNGYNLGAGADYTLSNNWAIRAQLTHYRVAEDGPGKEPENLLSAGVVYHF